MIFRKSKIQVLKVQHNLRDVVEDRSTRSFHPISGVSSSTTKTIKDVPFTTVLFVKDGELYTREFNGNWNLADIKKWEQK